MTVGERIRARRKSLRIEVEDLAKAAGLRPTTLYDLENGRSKSTTKLHHIARELGVSVEFLETGRNNRVEEPSPDATSHALRIDPAMIAAALQLVRLSFKNLKLEFDNEQDGVPLAFAYTYLFERGQREVTGENVVDFSEKLAERLQDRGNDETASSDTGRAGRGDRGQGERRKAS